MLRLVIACGGGIFTTTIVTDKIKQILRKEKIDHTITPAKITEIAKIQNADLIVVTGKTTVKNSYDTPIMIGIELLTGVGAEEFTREFLKQVKEIEETKKQGNS